jgi:MFS family permease
MTVIAHRLIDLSPLRDSANFRRLWIGTASQSFGATFTSLAVLYQVWELTHNPFWTGAVGLAIAVPTILSGLAGGALADATDRKTIVLWTTAGAIVVSLMLAVQAVIGMNSLPLLFLLAAAQAAFVAFGKPARKTFIPRLLEKDRIAAGVALTMVSFQVSLLIGPALAGLVIGRWGVATCYVVEAIAFCIALYGVSGLPRMFPTEINAQRSFTSIVDGLRFIRTRPLLSGSLLSDMAATLLAMPVALFPAINQEKFGGSPETLGLFLSAIAFGGVAASAFSGWLTRRPDIGKVQLTAAACWGAALLGAGLTGELWSVLAFLAIAGAADATAIIARSALIQIATPDEYRGSLSSVEHVAGLAGPELGNFRAGLMATYLPPTAVLAIGGGVCVLAITSIALANPEMRRYSTSRRI